ncbi:hypothetical protein K503DRAFT_777696 [Rhizopogon vinicolor AM-OR11-026]|uniref:MYND-type domain-containing protein n=1 Tax=Rhizopogon vinicolor AM-OR11-026 TaxID=1314800 RepID=A0A1B7MFE3_9AGAM|nr:hypothetical protein K503DRAFT_777696 [Rhizopogon vinicolor AM-OR11-026]
MKCSECKSVWYCSKECQKKYWPTHKPKCQNELKCTSGILVKLVAAFYANQELMAGLQLAVILACDLLNNPRLGIDIPFLERVDIALEPSELGHFVAPFLDGETIPKKLQGMVQLNTITPWDMTTDSPLTLSRLRTWHEARAKANARGFTKNRVGLVEFINSGENAGSLIFTGEMLMPNECLQVARKRKPFEFVSVLTGFRFKKHMVASTCLECVHFPHSPAVSTHGPSRSRLLYKDRST